MDELSEAWNGLMRVVADVAPVTHAAVLPAEPWSPGAEERLRITFDDTLRTWFALHGGSDPAMGERLLPFTSVIGLRHSVEHTAMIHDIWEEHGPEGEREERPAGEAAGTWLREYVLIGEDGCGGGILVDLRPGPAHGCLRFWDKVDADGLGVLAPGIADLLAQVTRSLLTGDAVGGWMPSVVDGSIDWEVDHRHL